MNKEKQKIIIERGIENGYKLPKGLDDAKLDVEYVIAYLPFEVILFDKSFAKAYWGEKWKEGDIASTPISKMFDEMPPKWQHHLKEAVISDNPIKYYFDNYEN